MGYLDYLRHGSKMFSKKGAMPAYLVYFIADACNAKDIPSRWPTMVPKRGNSCSNNPSIWSCWTF